MNLQTCRHLAAFSYERILWVLLRRNQCLEYRIPFASYAILKMSAAQLERAAITPYLFVQKLLSQNPYALRERVIDFSPLTLTMSKTPDNSSLEILEILPGGRFILAHTHRMVMLYDMGHPFSLFDGHCPKVLASQAVAHDVVELCYISLDHSTYLVGVNASSWQDGKSVIYVLQFSFDDENQTVALQEYPRFEHDNVNTIAMQSAGDYMLILTMFDVVKHDFKTGSQTFYDLAEDLYPSNAFQIWLMASDTTFVQAIENEDDNGQIINCQIMICTSPNTPPSATANSFFSVATSTSLENTSKIITMRQILPAPFLSLGYSAHDPDGLHFMCTRQGICQTYCMIDFNRALSSTTRPQPPIPIASHLPWLPDGPDSRFDSCLIDRHVVAAECPKDEGRHVRIMGCIEHIKPHSADRSMLEAPRNVQIARIHSDRAPYAVHIDAWRGCMYVTFEGEGQVIHVYDFVDPVI